MFRVEFRIEAFEVGNAGKDAELIQIRIYQHLISTGTGLLLPVTAPQIRFLNKSVCLPIPQNVQSFKGQLII